MNLKHVKEIVKFSEHLGLRAEAKMSNSTHIWIHLTDKVGRSYRVLMSVSPSDHRALKNCQSIIKRFARGEINNVQR